ncbi:MAG TPA: hypothetical protein PKA05_13240 [Roseiflexaceae bacterium]|nr:hypothetical protein [Roseiflexaceae bacterium]HMP41342.1 hypothetical protein [Roseiflexaceae bacterium]
MHHLATIFMRLDPPQKRLVQIHVCRNALQVWEAYVRQHAPFEYVDSIVGMQHRVDTDLPRAALIAVLTRADAGVIARRYAEPIAALHDDDLVLPDHIIFAYYAIYNLYRKYIEGRGIDDWLIVNQALAAEASLQRGESILTAALQRYLDDQTAS